MGPVVVLQDSRASASRSPVRPALQGHIVSYNRPQNIVRNLSIEYHEEGHLHHNAERSLEERKAALKALSQVFGPSAKVLNNHPPKT